MKTMRHLSFAWLASNIIAEAALAQTPMKPEIAQLFVGVWRAIPSGIYTEDAEGKRFYPFGETAQTRFILTADGYAANTLQFKERTNCANGASPRNCTAQEAEAAFQSASSYQYRYRFEPDADNPYKGKMIWDVDLSVYPNWVGKSLTRRYEMNPDGSKWMFLAPLPANPQLGLKVFLEREKPN
jgi:hypothetical protein